MASTSAMSTALFEWIGSFHLRRGVRAVEDLNDGLLLWDLLQDIDPNHFTGELPEKDPPDVWVPRWQNLKYIHKQLNSYLSEVAGQPSPNIGGTVDLQAIAQDQSAKDLNLLLKLILLAAISSPNASEYVMRMPQLSISTQAILRDIITDAQDSAYEEPPPLDDHPHAAIGVPQDLELAFEERVGKVIADNEKLQHEKKELQDLLNSMHDRHANLQEKHDSLQRELEDSQERLLNLRSGADSLAGREEARSKEQEHIISALESKYATSQEQVENLRRQNETLRIKNENAQKLQDDFDEIKIERDQLLRKANAAEKYKQKLQQSQDFEKNNAVLQAKIDELKRQLKQSDSRTFSSAELEREIDEYKRMLPRIEQDRHELSEMKKQLEYDNHVLLAKLDQATQQHSRDAATIESLRERVSGGGGGGSDGPGTPTTPRAGKGIPNFDDESDALVSDYTEKPSLEASLDQANELEAEHEQIIREAHEMFEKESNSMLESLRRQYEETGHLKEAEFTAIQKEFADRIEASNRSTQRVIEYARRQMTVISNLKEEISSRPTEPSSEPQEEPRAATPAPPEPETEPEPATTAEIDTLRKENKQLYQELNLITSAWYNLAARLQSPNVTVARGRGTTNTPEPKSWLGKTRRDVDRVMMGGR